MINSNLLILISILLECNKLSLIWNQRNLLKLLLNPNPRSRHQRQSRTPKRKLLMWRPPLLPLRFLLPSRRRTRTKKWTIWFSNSLLIMLFLVRRRSTSFLLICMPSLGRSVRRTARHPRIMKTSFVRYSTRKWRRNAKQTVLSLKRQIGSLTIVLLVTQRTLGSNSKCHMSIRSDFVYAFVCCIIFCCDSLNSKTIVWWKVLLGTLIVYPLRILILCGWKTLSAIKFNLSQAVISCWVSYSIWLLNTENHTVRSQ